jgi:hypothetical protein
MILSNYNLILTVCSYLDTNTIIVLVFPSSIPSNKIGIWSQVGNEMFVTRTAGQIEYSLVAKMGPYLLGPCRRMGSITDPLMADYDSYFIEY